MAGAKNWAQAEAKRRRAKARVARYQKDKNGKFFFVNSGPVELTWQIVRALIDPFYVFNAKLCQFYWFALKSQKK